MARAAMARTHTEAPGGGKPLSAVPGGDFASQLFWLAITFVALYVLMSRLALPRIGGDHRGAARQRIEGDLAEAKRLKDAVGRGAGGLREGAGRCAHPRAGARQRDPRQANGRGRRAPQGAGSEAQRQARRGREDHRRDQDRRHGNVRGIAADTAGGHRRAADRHGAGRAARSKPRSPTC